jgi:pyruvate dehydrogenase E1 component
VRTDGQILEEGISEAGSVASAIAAGTAHVVHGIQTVPFFFFYSMFGFQRVGDLLWAAADARTRAFLIGATSGRTTLEGEGLQHQDGHSHVLALTHPRVRAYDPAFGYEVATLVEEGLCALGERGEDLLYYLTVNNEPGSQPPRPVGVAEGIRRGMYRLQASSRSTEHEPVQLLASGPMVRIAQQAQAKLEQEFDLAAEVWSVTSWTELYRDASLCERYNRLHPCATPKRAYLQEMLGSASVVVAVSDWMKALPDLLGRWMPPGFVTLGTDGLGRSDGRGALRAFFEVDVRHVVQAAVRSLAALGRCSVERAEIVTRELGIMPDIPCPTTR